LFLYAAWRGGAAGIGDFGRNQTNQGGSGHGHTASPSLPPIGAAMQTCASGATNDRREPGSAMTSVNHLQKLADQLAQSARSRIGAQLSRHSTALLLAVIRANGDAGERGRPSDAYAFRIVAGDFDGRFEDILARTSDLSIARAMFDQAARQTPHQNIRLMKGLDVLEET
jgi:hypothetical protein